MEAESVELLTTRKGKPLLVVDGYQHRLHREKNQIFRWICISEKKDNCRGAVKTNLKNEILARSGHICQPNVEALEIKKIIDVCKKRIREDIGVPVHVIFKEVTRGFVRDGFDVTKLPKYDSLKTSLCAIRRGMLRESGENLVQGAEDVKYGWFAGDCGFLENKGRQPQEINTELEDVNEDTTFEELSVKTENEETVAPSAPKRLKTLSQELRNQLIVETPPQTERPDDPVAILPDAGRRSDTADELREIQTFCAYLSSKMRSYSRTTRLGVQHAVYDILIKADRGEFQTPTPMNTQHHEESLPQAHAQPWSLQSVPKLQFRQRRSSPTSPTTRPQSNAVSSQSGELQPSSSLSNHLSDDGGLSSQSSDGLNDYV